MEWIEVCQHCLRAFSVVEVGGDSGPLDRKAIECPHCKRIWGYVGSSGIFMTAALTDEQQQLLKPGQAK
jgi:hypothetical protein